MTPLLESIKRSLHKYNRTREPASNASKEACHNIHPLIHPLLANSMEQKDVNLMNFREGIKNYKAKVCGLEVGIRKTKDERAIESFTAALREQN